MNGARTTYMRRGFLLTALAAAALLAVSPGTAEAQSTGVTITGPSNNMVNEGGVATYTVAIRGYIAAATDGNSDGTIDNTEAVAATTATYTFGRPTPGSDATTAGEDSDLSLNDVPTAGITLTFNIPGNSSTVARLHQDSKVIRMSTLQDEDAENEVFVVAFAQTGAGDLTVTAGGSPIALATPGTAANPNALTIDDDETQTYKLALDPTSQKPTEGTPITVALTAVPAHVNGSKVMSVSSDKDGTTGWSVAPTTATIGVGGVVSQTITITNPLNDKNRVSDTVTVRAHSGQLAAPVLEDSLTITVADTHALQAVTAKVVDKDGKVLDPQPMSVEEGMSVKIAVMPVDKDGKVTTADEKLTITLASSGSADSRDFRLSAPIEITSGQNKSNVVDLVAEMDEDVGMEMLMLDATVSGEAGNGTETSMSAGVLSLDITDATEKKIWPKDSEADYDNIKAEIAKGAGDDEVLNPGEMVTIMTDDLFGVMDGYTGSYSVSVEGSAVSASASGDAVNIEAMVKGESKVTVTGTARMSSSLESSQTVSNVASLTFPVTVDDMPLMITLAMPDNVMDGNIVEGSSYDIGVMANRMITEAEGSVEVMIMRDRAESDANDDDFEVSSATIMAGYDSATAELMVTEDMADDSGHAMGEALVLYGEYGDGKETNSLMFTIWDTAVPALPLIAQILLALFLALGGARLYRRRQG